VNPGAVASVLRRKQKTASSEPDLFRREGCDETNAGVRPTTLKEIETPDGFFKLCLRNTSA
jgi:hypothetical protein